MILRTWVRRAPFCIATMLISIPGLLEGWALGSAFADTNARRCDEDSWIGGTTEWCDGTLVYRDYVYDDTGSDLGRESPHGTGYSRPLGDVDHREHGQALNSADLLVLRLRLEGDDLIARFELNTLFPTDETFAALALDIDDDATTGGGGWRAVDVRSDGWELVETFRARNATTNVIEGRMTLPPTAGDTVRIQAVIALGDGTPMNVAFRPSDHGNWWEDEQAAALEAKDVSPFGYRFAIRDLRSRKHRPAASPGPGYYERIYRSEYPLGEGVSAEGVERETSYVVFGGLFHYLGRHQPYAVFVPSGSPPYGAQLTLHPLGSAHGNPLPGFTQRMGEEQHRILLTPLGRGPQNYWADWGARDALDVLDDAMKHYAIDPDRLVVAGYSMGGGGTFALATMFPDRFAAALTWVGFTGDCNNGTPFAQGRQRPTSTEALGPYDPTGHASNSPERRSGCPLGARGNAFDYLENLRHVPSAHVFGAADYFDRVQDVAIAQRLEELGYEHRIWNYAGEHLVFVRLDDWRKEAAWSHGRRVVRRPARVRYRTNRYLSTPKLDIVADGAYWIDQLRPRYDSPKPDGDMVVDLTSHRCPPTSERRHEFSRDAGTDPVPWIGQKAVPTDTVAIKLGGRISGTLTNVSSLAIDVEGACFTPGAPIELDIRSDGPALVRFSDGRRAVRLG